jgi:hypothetical protein
MPRFIFCAPDVFFQLVWFENAVQFVPSVSVAFRGFCILKTDGGELYFGKYCPFEFGKKADSVGV